jgi:GTP-binding protein HflX
VAAFRATLEEIAEADLLLHIVDITHTNARAQAEAVGQTLAEIEADHIPVLTVLNKIDRLADPDRAQQALASFSKSVAISALKGLGIQELLKAVSGQLFETYTPIRVLLPYQEGALISLFHEFGRIDQIEHERKGVIIAGKIPGRLIARYRSFEHLNAVHLDGPEPSLDFDPLVDSLDDSIPPDE